MRNDLRATQGLLPTQPAVDVRRIRERLAAIAPEVRTAGPHIQSEYRMLNRRCERLELRKTHENREKFLTITETIDDEPGRVNLPNIPAPSEWGDSVKSHALAAKKFAGLKHLELDCNPLSTTVSFDSLENWLGGLDTLSIRSWDPRCANIWDESRDVPAKQYALRALALENCIFDRTTLIGFLKKFPRLESLALSSGYQEADDSPSDHLLSFLCGNCPYLRHLNLGIMGFVSDNKENKKWDVLQTHKQISLDDLPRLFPKLSVNALTKFQKHFEGQLRFEVRLMLTSLGKGLDGKLKQTFSSCPVDGFSLKDFFQN